LKIFKKWWFWLLVVIVAASLTTGGEEETATKVDSEPASAETSKDSKEEDITEKEFSVGDKVKLESNVLTVKEVKKSQGDEFDRPKEGYEYVILSVEIENDGDDRISYNPYDFEMSNSQGNITDITFTTIDTDTALSSGELAPGGKVSGTLAFEQPINDTKLQLLYTPSFWSDKTITINIK
jgi:hypothetical protein